MQLIGLNGGAGGMFSAPSSDPLILALTRGGRASPVKGRNPLARRKSSCENFCIFFFLLICGRQCLFLPPACERAFWSIIWVGNMQTISLSFFEDRICSQVGFNPVYFDTSNRTQVKQVMLWKVKKKKFLSNFTFYHFICSSIILSVTVLKSMFLRRNQIDIIVS